MKPALSSPSGNLPISLTMDHTDLQLLNENPTWALVLKAYRQLLDEIKLTRSEDEQGIRWATRIAHFADVELSELNAIHGQLIAMDWLTFQLEDRNAGLMYRLTAEGREILNAFEKTSAPQDVAA